MSPEEHYRVIADIEKIFQDVLMVLAEVIDQYREVLIEYSDDQMSGLLDHFCDQMEVLKHTIEDDSLKITERVACVGEINKLLFKLMNDEGVTEEINCNFIKRNFHHLKTQWSTLFGLKEQSEHAQFEQANAPINEQQPAHDKYFNHQKMLLDQIISEHPDIQ